ncbi:MAG: hypothetical protein RL358_1086 [Pseudomonadota bacterium]|jgi:hypothetical protein
MANDKKSMHDKFHDIETNSADALKIFKSYYGDHNHSGKIYSDFPDFFIVKSSSLEGCDIATRPSEKMLLDDCIKRANERRGYIGVSKHRNPKLGYYWLELSVLPFMLGDAVNKDNKGEFFYVLTKFVEFTKKNPSVYGDMTADMSTDQDLAFMFDSIKRMAERMSNSMENYPENMLVAYNPSWPAAEVKNLLNSLQNNSQDWCQLFFEHVMYVMANKHKN